MEKETVINSIYAAVQSDSIFWKDHILQRIRSRGMQVSRLLEALRVCEVINEYPDDRPFPSYLLLGFADNKPYHIVAGVNIAEAEIHLITAYIPDSDIWHDDYRRKK